VSEPNRFLAEVFHYGFDSSESRLKYIMMAGLRPAIAIKTTFGFLPPVTAQGTSAGSVSSAAKTFKQCAALFERSGWSPGAVTRPCGLSQSEVGNEKWEVED